MSIQEKIRQKCREKGISVTVLEEKLGFGNGSLTKKGASIRSDRLFEVAKALDTPMEFFVDDDYSERIAKTYYIDDETAQTALEIKEDYGVLFDAFRSSYREKLVDYAEKIMELERMEKDT